MISLDDAAELAAYHDEPAQLPSGAPGKVGRLRLRFERRDDRTVLADLYRQAPLLVQRALYWDTAMPEMACVFIVATSGGMLQGDRNEIDISLGDGARAHLTTQAATKVQEMDANYASAVQRIVLADDAYLEYLPEPTIPFRHSRFVTRTHVTLPESATMLYAEILTPGRMHRNDEVFRYDVLSSTVRAARPTGADLFVEKFVITPGHDGVQRKGVLGDFRVYANVVLLTASEHANRLLDAVTPLWDDSIPLAAGANRLPNDAGVVYKVLGRETEPVRERVREFCAVARVECVGRPVPPRFAWR